MHHLLLGHGLALPILRANAPQALHGIVANCAPGYADSDTAADRDAASLFETYQNRWVLDPLLKGEYPADLWRLWKGCEPLALPGDMEGRSLPGEDSMRAQSDAANGARSIRNRALGSSLPGWRSCTDSTVAQSVRMRSVVAPTARR